jgi:hypothetical protein
MEVSPDYLQHMHPQMQAPQLEGCYASPDVGLPIYHQLDYHQHHLNLHPVQQKIKTIMIIQPMRICNGYITDIPQEQCSLT